ncbi:MAG: glycoside hydrolase family 32 protein [bacterium]
MKTRLTPPMVWIVALLSAALNTAAGSEPSGSPSEGASMDAYHQGAIAKAEASVAQARINMAKDPTRPAYHFQAPANWMNDPNGPIYYNGEYHLFYQHNPYGENWGHMHWGHAHSRDLVHWEHLPIALAPSEDRGEEHCFSGSAVVDESGIPRAFYTSIGPKTPAGDGAVQWMAYSEDGLRTWKKFPGNPVMTEQLHGSLKILDWRDPFVWRENGAWYAVLGGHPQGGRVAAFIYQSPNLVDWKFLNILYQSKPEDQEGNWECPNFFALGGKRVLVYSPHGRVRYYTGDLLPDYTFKPGFHGVLDYSPNFYAPNGLLDGQGRRILWGWIREVKGPGWNGAFTLPRILILRPDGSLGMEPAPELEVLRESLKKIENRSLDSQPIILDERLTGCVEIQAVFEPGAAESFGLRLRAAPESAITVPVTWNRAARKMTIGGESFDFTLEPEEKSLDLRVFVDKMIVEVYVNRRACCTLVVPDLRPDRLVIEGFAEKGPARLVSFKTWEMKPIWEK